MLLLVSLYIQLLHTGPLETCVPLSIVAMHTHTCSSLSNIPSKTLGDSSLCIFLIKSSLKLPNSCANRPRHHASVAEQVPAECIHTLDL